MDWKVALLLLGCLLLTSGANADDESSSSSSEEGYSSKTEGQDDLERQQENGAEDYGAKEEGSQDEAGKGKKILHSEQVKVKEESSESNFELGDDETSSTVKTSTTVAPTASSSVKRVVVNTSSVEITHGKMSGNITEYTGSQNVKKNQSKIVATGSETNVTTKLISTSSIQIYNNRSKTKGKGKLVKTYAVEYVTTGPIISKLNETVTERILVNATISKVNIEEENISFLEKGGTKNDTTTTSKISTVSSKSKGTNTTQAVNGSRSIGISTSEEYGSGSIEREGNATRKSKGLPQVKLQQKTMRNTTTSVSIRKEGNATKKNEKASGTKQTKTMRVTTTSVLKKKEGNTTKKNEEASGTKQTKTMRVTTTSVLKKKEGNTTTKIKEPKRTREPTKPRPTVGGDGKNGRGKATNIKVRYKLTRVTKTEPLFKKTFRAPSWTVVKAPRSELKEGHGKNERGKATNFKVRYKITRVTKTEPLFKKTYRSPSWTVVKIPKSELNKGYGKNRKGKATNIKVRYKFTRVTKTEPLSKKTYHTPSWTVVKVPKSVLKKELSISEPLTKKGNKERVEQASTNKLGKYMEELKSFRDVYSKVTHMKDFFNNMKTIIAQSNLPGPKPVGNYQPLLVCSSQFIEVLVETDRFPHIRWSDASLNHPHCKPIIDKDKHTALFRFPLGKCGCKIERNGNHIIYSNTIRPPRIGEHGEINRHHQHWMKFSCVYDSQMPSQVVSFKPAYRRKMFVAKGYGKLEVSVGLAKDPKFHVQVYPADNVDVSNRLFVGLTLASDNSNLKLIVDSCLASPTSPPNRYQEHLIKDGCFVDNTVKYEGEGPNYYHFSFQSFEFVDYGQRVFITCSIHVCPLHDKSRYCKNPRGPCPKRAKRSLEGREIPSDAQSFTIEHGPFNLVHGSSGKASVMKGKPWKQVTLVLGASCLVVAAAMITVWRKRSHARQPVLP